MTQFQTLSARMLARVLLVSAIGAGSAALAWSAPPMAGHEGHGSCPAHDMEHMKAWMQARLHERLARMSERLEIRASQQPAWQAYAHARMAMFDNMKPHAPQADAVSIAQFRAARAADLAQGLAAISDATAKLSAVLDANQRSLLDQMAHEHAGRGRFAWWHHGEQGGDNGHGHGPR